MSNFQFIVAAVRRSWAEQNKDLLLRYARALASSYRYMRAVQNRDEVVRLIVETTGSSDTIARETPQTLLRARARRLSEGRGN
jgi:ABC-type nitrate/sulfonate/bicarbonate transport system substrate-binding protein